MSCVVLAGDEWDRLSDHNPVVACLLLTAGVTTGLPTRTSTFCTVEGPGWGSWP